MSDTSRLNLPLIAAAQAQKHVTHNEALLALDALVQLAVEDDALSSPPSVPAEGSRYIVAAAAAGAWAGQAGKVAVYQDGLWQFLTPRAGWRAWVVSRDLLQVYDGAAWKPALAIPSSLPMLGINANASAATRLTVSAAGTLLNHAGGDHRLTVNKNAPANVASLLFQTATAGRAEIGLTGDDDLHVKISNGSGGFRDVLVVQGGTGRVGIGTLTPGAELEVADSSGDGDCRIQLRANASEAGQIGVSPSQLFIDTTNAKPLVIYTNGTARFFIGANGNVGIGTQSPVTRLDVDGPVKVKSYTVSALPSAAASGSGALVYVSNESGGAVLAFSDGTAWRRVTDRLVVA